MKEDNKTLEKKKTIWQRIKVTVARLIVLAWIIVMGIIVGVFASRLWDKILETPVDGWLPAFLILLSLSAIFIVGGWVVGWAIDNLKS